MTDRTLLDRITHEFVEAWIDGEESTVSAEERAKRILEMIRNSPSERVIEEDTERKHCLMRMTPLERDVAIAAIKAFRGEGPVTYGVRA